MINRTVRNFEIKELIATGGMAAIYKAVQVSLDRIVAIKILHGHLAQDKNFITRFEREAKAAANLQHENIVNIIDYGKDGDIYFIAMEYVDGRSLKDLIASIKFIPPDIALTIAREIALGLDHAHRKGVVHRDIKPANILIGHNGVSKIADFGLAQAQDLTSVTVTGSIVGTPAYMSPEQAGGRKVDFRTDIFSLGVVIYEMITGVKPFSGDNYSSVIHEILTVQPVKPIEANPLLPSEISDTIERMLKKDVDTRYQSISEVINDINNYTKRRNIEVSKKQIGDFLTAPNEQFKNLVVERKGKHLERAAYYEKQGDDKIDSAIQEYSKVIHLDPDDDKAKKRLSALREKKSKIVKKAPAVKKPLPAEQVKAIPPRKKKKSSLPVILVFCVVAIALAFVVIRNIRNRRLHGMDTTPVGYASITSEPDSAAITLDGKNLQKYTPVRLDSLAKGDHTIELTHNGYQPYSYTFSLTGNDTIEINAVLLSETTGVRVGSFRITSTPPGAKVFLDGKNTGSKTPCVLEDINPGSYRIRLSKSGYKETETTKTVQANQETYVSLKLDKIKQGDEPRPVPKVSFLRVTAKPWAKIYIDNKYIETTPIAQPIKVPAGSHTVKLENPNFKVWEQQIVFVAEQTHTIDARLEPLDGYLKVTVKPWADVYIDGKFYETTPIAKPIKLSAGQHSLKLINPSLKPYEKTVTIQANKTLVKHVELEKK